MSSFPFFFQKEALGQNIIFLVVSSARSTIVNPDPLFQIRTVLINNISYRGILAAAMYSITQHIFWLPIGHPTYHDISWHIMTYHDISWHIMTYYDKSWHIMTNHFYHFTSYIAFPTKVILGWIWKQGPGISECGVWLHEPLVSLYRGTHVSGPARTFCCPFGFPPSVHWQQFFFTIPDIFHPFLFHLW